MNSSRKTLLVAVLASETSHIFCCVLPTVVSILGLLSGLGFVIALPPFLESVHEYLHQYEPYMIAASALILGLGWVFYRQSRRVDCHDTGCRHGDCAPRKDHVRVILIIASILFVVNLLVYMGFHAR